MIRFQAQLDPPKSIGEELSKVVNSAPMIMTGVAIGYDHLILFLKLYVLKKLALVPLSSPLVVNVNCFFGVVMHGIGMKLMVLQLTF